MQPSNQAARRSEMLEKILRMPTRRSLTNAVGWKNHENKKHDDDSEREKCVWKKRETGNFFINFCSAR
jgi:hypothetical protein